MGGNIFNGNINGRATAWMMIGMLVFAVAWESFTSWLERRFEENKAHSEILSKVYKELMILGFIAFALIMGKEIGVVTWNNETLHCFEFCDLLVSICVLVYVANCAVFSISMHTAQRNWDRIALTPTVEVRATHFRNLHENQPPTAGRAPAAPASYPSACARGTFSFGGGTDTWLVRVGDGRPVVLSRHADGVRVQAHQVEAAVHRRLARRR